MAVLVERLDRIIKRRCHGSEDYIKVAAALTLFDQVMMVVQSDSLANDGWQMIESALRDLDA